MSRVNTDHAGWGVSMLCLFGAALFCSTTARAEHIDLTVVYTKPPDMSVTAAVIQAEYGAQDVASDWLVTTSAPKPIVAARWWGSYLDPNFEPDPNFVPDPNDPPETKPFVLAFYDDDVGAPSPPFYPEDLDWGHYAVDADEEFYGFDDAGNAVWEYNAYLPPLPYDPPLGFSYYWMSLQLWNDDLGWPTDVWGWHSSSFMARDGDVTETGGGGWSKLTVDLAFELMTGLTADANGDGCVNVADLGILGAQWGTAGPEADFNSDGTVGVGDLGMLALQWGMGCTGEAGAGTDGAAAVPGPPSAAAGLALLGALGLTGRRRRV